ncbi:MAG TPA: amidohydrolase family protein, partial [Gemmatimonadaceae bacterium]
MFGALAASGTWVTPTLTIHDLMLRVGRRLDAARDTTFFLEAGTPGLFSETRSAKTLRLAAENWALYQQVVRDLRDAGVKLLAGSDVPTQIVAGAGLQAELILLQRAGLSPLEALQTATLQPARYFAATDSMGTIAPGHVADLVFLARNPLEDVANVQTIEGVM